MKRAGIILIVIFLFMTFYVWFYSAPQSGTDLGRFVVPLGTQTSDIPRLLVSEGFIRHRWGLYLAEALYGFKTIKPGGYKISTSMNVFEIASILFKDPYMKWIVIPEGLRKEEVRDILGDQLKWGDVQKKEWMDSASKNLDYFEGVYFPDTYLIPIAETPSEIAKRFQTKFQEVFAAYAKEALRQNIKWTTVVTIASLIQREAARKDDMSMIAGVIWNRLLKGMNLQIDATVQYARGKTEKGWWAPIAPEDKKIDSPYNTYMYKGLPPHPIASPGLFAIEAALHPVKTDCLYYLHDARKQIHCSKTYKEHRENIKKYLGS